MSVRFEKLSVQNGFLGVITLERSRAINSLNLEMCQSMSETLSKWKDDPKIYCILIQGQGDKGFCAGGDVKLVREAIVKSKREPREFQYVLDFFCQEYRNDYQLTLINKPVICWATGITMGGGMGLMQGCSYRVVTETSTLAMPEISIGLYPDVGAAYFLSRLPPGVGLFLGLTGARFGPHDAIELGLADFYIKSSEQEKVLKYLLTAEWSDDVGTNHNVVTEALLKYKFPMRLRSTISNHLHYFIKLDRAETVQEAVSFIQELAQKSPWIAECYEFLKKGSPLSAALIFQYLKNAKKLTRRDVFIQDFNLSIQCSLHQDFVEGVRSVLVDKNTTANWEFKTFDISPSIIESYFEDPWRASKSETLLGTTHPFLPIISALDPS